MSKGDTTEVGSYPTGVSAYGAFDMAGNVFDWTASVTGAFKILRGGSWDYYREDARCAFRFNGIDPEITSNNIGFRCART